MDGGENHEGKRREEEKENILLAWKVSQVRSVDACNQKVVVARMKGPRCSIDSETDGPLLVLLQIIHLRFFANFQFQIAILYVCLRRVGYKDSLYTRSSFNFYPRLTQQASRQVDCSIW